MTNIFHPPNAEKSPPFASISVFNPLVTFPLSLFTHNSVFDASIHTAVNRWLLYIDTGSVKCHVSFYLHTVQILK